MLWRQSSFFMLPVSYVPSLPTLQVPSLPTLYTTQKKIPRPVSSSLRLPSSLPSVSAPASSVPPCHIPGALITPPLHTLPDTAPPSASAAFSGQWHLFTFLVIVLELFMLQTRPSFCYFFCTLHIFFYSFLFFSDIWLCLFFGCFFLHLLTLYCHKTSLMHSNKFCCTE